jgi:SAM-dependent methyltransferase
MNAESEDTDLEWEEWGRRDPYYGVITDPRFRFKELTETSRHEFFESGRAHADYVLEMIRRHMDPRFQPTSVLDFGCGVGRVIVAFAKVAKEVVGLDVSASMLAECRKNCDAAGLGNVRLLVSDDSLSSLEGSFDLIHSFIVFQHIPPERGRGLFRKLLTYLRPGGACAVHFSYSKSRYANSHGVAPPLSPLLAHAARVLTAPLIASVRAFNPEPPADPEMQMNCYGMNEMLFLIQGAGVRRVHAEFTDHGGELGVFLFFQKPIES